MSDGLLLARRRLPARCSGAGRGNASRYHTSRAYSWMLQRESGEGVRRRNRRLAPRPRTFGRWRRSPCARRRGWTSWSTPLCPGTDRPRRPAPRCRRGSRGPAGTSRCPCECRPRWVAPGPTRGFVNAPRGLLSCGRSSAVSGIVRTPRTSSTGRKRPSMRAETTRWNSGPCSGVASGPP